MSSAVGAADFKQAAMHLEQLLIKEPYRRRWTRYERQRERRNRVHQKSVARVLTEYVDRNREDLRYRDISLKSLTQRVSKVFNGTVLSKQMLQLFIDAFEIIPRDAERLWRIYEGTDKIRVLTGPGALPPDTAAALGPVKHRTISVHEYHYLGEDGLPTRHRTRQVIQAISDGLDRYPYRFDTNALTVEVEEGGRLADPLYHVRGDIYAVDIMLEEPLLAGDEAPLTYLTLFYYDEAPKREFRRAAQGRIDDVGLQVKFHQERLPSVIRWAAWNGVDGGIIHQEEVELRAHSYVYRHMEYIENAVVGFCWDWLSIHGLMPTRNLGGACVTGNS